jgi:hypothetical protein
LIGEKRAYKPSFFVFQIANAQGINFQFSLTPAVSYLSVLSSTATVLNNVAPAARILLTQIPSKGFVNGQFTLTATAGTLTGSTSITLTINCLPQFVSSSGGRPSFTQPVSIAQPVTYKLKPADVFSITIGDNTRGQPGIFVNCKDEDITNDQATLLTSSLGFVTVRLLQFYLIKR